MKLFFTSLSLIFLLSACADKDAFSKFQLTQKQEYAENSIQSAKINSQNGVEGIFSAIYLNEVMPQRYKGNEYFFVFYTLKDDNKSLDIFLNLHTPIKQTPLKTTNEFSKLIISDIKWNKYYLLEYKKEQSNILNLQLKGKKFSSSVLKYKKNEE